MAHNVGADAGGLKAPRVGRDFVAPGSVVRKIWGDTELVLLIFAGSAAEFALNRAVDWLFFTGKIPADPVGRLFSTVRYAQEIVFAETEAAQRTLAKINAIHGAVERQRGQSIPDWAFRDVLYMLVDYSERAHRMLYGPLSRAEREELYLVFRRVGEGLNVKALPVSYEEWRDDRRLHLVRDLDHSRHTALLYGQYRRHLGEWRYQVLRGVQALLVPERVRRLLRLRRRTVFSALVGGYGRLVVPELRPLVRRLMVQPRYWDEVKKMERGLSKSA
ncbi:MAG: oxygenase MpaB family protein [Pyrinomonadaceae bacterium]